MIDLHGNDQFEARQRLWSEPRANNLLEMIAMPAERYPDVVAIGLCHHGREPEAITWGELCAGASRRAIQLRELGLRKNDRVMIVLATSREFFEFFFGILFAGGIPVPTAPPTSLREHKLNAYRDLLNLIAVDSGAVACVGLSRIMKALQGGLQAVNSKMRMLMADEYSSLNTTLSLNGVDDSDTVLLQYTSGSTSHPKGVELSHRNILANAAAIAKACVRIDTVSVSWLPLYHDMGLIGTFLTAIYCRVPTVLMPPQAFIKCPALWLRCISDYRGTITVAPNFAFIYCVKNVQIEDVADVSLESLQTALNGAEPVDLVAVAEFYEKFKPLGLRDGVISPVYGLAESSLAVSFSAPGPLVIDRVDATQLEHAGHAVPAQPTTRRRSFVSVGRELATQEIQIVDGAGSILAERQVGEIVVRGPSVMKGYFNRASETAEVVQKGWLHTGDLGYLADGQLYVTGRTKDIIIRHGRNYYPQDIETAVATVAGISKGGAAAFSIEGDGDTKVVVLAETRARDAQLREEMVRHIRTRCHDAFLFGPDSIVLVVPGSIPRTTSGKIRRRESRNLYLRKAFEGPALRTTSEFPEPGTISHSDFANVAVGK
jgi:acyl-CoA synthetase (AMP-forming)/AMP-acid ligase II